MAFSVKRSNMAYFYHLLRAGTADSSIGNLTSSMSQAAGKFLDFAINFVERNWAKSRPNADFQQKTTNQSRGYSLSRIIKRCNGSATPHVVGGLQLLPAKFATRAGTLAFAAHSAKELMHLLRCLGNNVACVQLPETQISDKASVRLDLKSSLLMWLFLSLDRKLFEAMHRVSIAQAPVSESLDELPGL
jgi:hypothetical protein